MTKKQTKATSINARTLAYRWRSEKCSQVTSCREERERSPTPPKEMPSNLPGPADPQASRLEKIMPETQGWYQNFSLDPVGISTTEPKKGASSRRPLVGHGRERGAELLSLLLGLLLLGLVAALGILLVLEVLLVYDHGLGDLGTKRLVILKAAWGGQSCQREASEMVGTHRLTSS